MTTTRSPDITGTVSPSSRAKTIKETTLVVALTITNCDLLAFGTEENVTYYVLCEEMVEGQVYEHSVILACGLKPLSVDHDLWGLVFVPECEERKHSLKGTSRLD